MDCAVVGVPVSVTELVVLLLKPRPAGSVPALTDQVKGARPPLAWMVWLYKLPTMPFGDDVVVMLGGGGLLIWSVNACDADWRGLELSCTLTLIGNDPACPGVPESTPPVLRVMLLGSVPVSLHVKDAWPPLVTVKVNGVYAVPFVPAGGAVVLMTGAGGRLMVMESANATVSGPALLESVTFTEKFD